MQTVLIDYEGVPVKVGIVYTSSDFVVIDKPAGISVHKDDAEEGLISLLASALGIAQLYLVHRLDKVTSGLLLLATHSQAASQLSELFKNREMSKCYLALSDKKPKKKH